MCWHLGNPSRGWDSFIPFRRKVGLGRMSTGSGEEWQKSSSLDAFNNSCGLGSAAQIDLERKSHDEKLDFRTGIDFFLLWHRTKVLQLSCRFCHKRSVCSENSALRILGRTMAGFRSGAGGNWGWVCSTNSRWIVADVEPVKDGSKLRLALASPNCWRYGTFERDSCV